MDPNQDDQGQNPATPADDGMGGQPPVGDTDANPTPIGDGDAELPPSPPVVEDSTVETPAEPGSEEPAGDTNPAV